MLTAESVKSLGKALLAAHEQHKSEVSPVTRLHAPRPCFRLKCAILGASLEFGNNVRARPSDGHRRGRAGASFRHLASSRVIAALALQRA